MSARLVCITLETINWLEISALVSNLPSCLGCVASFTALNSQKAAKLAVKLHAHSVQYAYKIILFICYMRFEKTM